MRLPIENPKNFTKKLLEPIDKFSKVVGYEINIHLALLIPGVYICRFNQPWITSIWKKKIPEISQNQNLNFPHASSYLLSFTLDLYYKQFRNDIEYMQGCSWIICKYYAFSCKRLAHLWILVLCLCPGTNSLWIHRTTAQKSVHVYKL